MCRENNYKLNQNKKIKLNWVTLIFFLFLLYCCKLEYRLRFFRNLNVNFWNEG
jgi:hypothetical protein